MYNILYWIFFCMMALASLGGLMLLFNNHNTSKRVESLPIIAMILMFLSMCLGLLKGLRDKETMSSDPVDNIQELEKSEDEKKSKEPDIKQKIDSREAPARKETTPPRKGTEIARVPRDTHDFHYRLIVTRNGLEWWFRNGSTILLPGRGHSPNYPINL